VNPVPDTLTALFADAAARRPDAPAVIQSDGQSVRYAELEDLSARIAAHLRGMGVQRGDRVGICMPKSINSVACVLGILRAGAAYVPVDHSGPPDRNRFIFANCATRVICADGPRAERLGPGVAPFLTFPGEATASIGAPQLSGQPRGQDAPVSAGDLSYILYTSGSTGQPKGVVHTHASALSFVLWAADLMKPTPADRFSSHASFHFDLSILDLYVPMTVGAAIVLVDESLGKDAMRLAEFIAQQQITAWYSVPSILALLAQYGRLDQYDFSALRVVNFAGEVFPVKHLRLLKQFWKHPIYYNLYGPTETNVCTYYRIPDTIPAERQEPFPIGIACENVEAIVFDENMKPVVGGEGVLYIAQSGPVMRDYWNLPEQTARAFYTDPAGRRWYCTGDVVLPDERGDWLFLGRRDRMVKRRGFRIELGEIEAGLYKHPSVHEAATVAYDGAEGVVIDAFLTPKPGEKLSVLELKQFCAKQLLSYMNPDRFIFVTELPRTSTGKVDYQSLLKQSRGPTAPAASR